MSETMTGAEMVIRALHDQGVEHIFGYPGGAVLPIYDALFTRTRCGTCSSGTSRGRFTQRKVMPARPASPAWCW
jgi:hypothetical protein